MIKAEKFLAGEMAMRLAGHGGFQWCTWPCGDEPCYELLWPGQLEAADYGKRLFVCPRHKRLHERLQRPLQDEWSD